MKTSFRKYFPALSIGGYWLSLYALHGFRIDHFIIGLLIIILSYLTRISTRPLKFALPFLLTLIIYDSQRFYGDYLRGTIHVSEAYHFDKTYFGIQSGSTILTPNEWWQLHTHPFLDLITGFAYLFFFAGFVTVSAYFIFFKSKTGSKRFLPHEFSARAVRMPWAFLWLNLLGYSTYYWYASAPPWYVALYGMGPIQMVPPNSAGCARFDQLLGTHFFTEFYSRSADVFGAIPSLHVAYPMLALFFALYLGSLRVFCLAFFLLMAFSAVYLNHHYILDILWGSFYAILVGWLTNQFYDLRSKRPGLRLV